jgi:hypothetical protein
VELLFFDVGNFALTREIPYILDSVYAMFIDVRTERVFLFVNVTIRIRY